MQSQEDQPRAHQPLVDAGLVSDSLGLRETLVVILRVLVILGTTMVVYAVLPIDDEESATTATAIFAGVGLLVVLAVYFAQFRRIERAERPMIAAIEALVLVFGMFLSLFAFIYVSLSAADPQAFSEPLDKVAGVYFSVTVMATVGFGDIAPLSPTARILATVNMLVNIVLLGSAVKLLAHKAQRARELRRQGPHTHGAGERGAHPQDPRKD
jgi:voltage-gated potassium channel